MIKLINLEKFFANSHVLKNINLEINEGEIFGIIGHSGAGKSTLLRTINLLERPTSGRVLIDEVEVTQSFDLKSREAIQKTAMVFQHFNLLSSKNVYDNIAIPMRIKKIPEPEIKQKINELLPLIGLEDKKDAYPSMLSGGQKQRVAIARALSTSPRILLCDEATSALDPKTTNEILDLLQQINQLYNITIVIVTHEMNVIKKICHRLALMENGQIVESQSMLDVLNNKDSRSRELLYEQLSPKLPECLKNAITSEKNNYPLIRIFFENEGAKIPFISQTSRKLNLDINILLANIDRVNGVTCGVLIIELCANDKELKLFIDKCQQAQLSVEILGYVANNNF